MRDFTEQFRAQVNAARKAEQREEAEESQALRDRRLRADELARHVEQRFQAAEHVDPSAIRFSTVPDSEGVATFQLSWNTPLPARTLMMRVDRTLGQFWWQWVHGGGQSGWAEIDVLKVDFTKIDQLIQRLADQPTWASGNEPNIHLGEDQTRVA